MWSFATVNSTTWQGYQRQWASWYHARPFAKVVPHVTMMQEHHLSAACKLRAERWVFDRGLRMQLSVSEQSGGAALLHRAHLGIQSCDFDVPEGRCAGGIIQGIFPGGLLCVSIYLRCAVPAEEQALYLGPLMEAIVRSGKQYLIAGDWQMSPEELHRTGFVDGVAGVVISTKQITCWSGARRELDFFVVSKPVAALVSHVARDEYSVTRPHDALRLFLNPKALHIKVPVAVRFAKGACARPAGPAIPPRLCAWQWQGETHHFDVGRGFEEWAAEVDAWRVQWGCASQPDRGAGIRRIWQPLHSVISGSKPPLDTPLLCAWRWLLARCRFELGRRGWLRARRAGVQPASFRHVLPQ
eukprot:6439096-Amphidinium_carterae.2